MRGSWNESRVWGNRERFGDSFRGWLGRFGSVTQFIVVLTAIVFAFQKTFQIIDVYSPGTLPNGFMETIFGFNGYQFLHGFIWQPVTYMLLHDPNDILHIIFNLLLLWFFGREVEYFIGPKSFAKLYLMAGVMGASIWWVFNLHYQGPLIGASAAVMGCIIAFATLFPDKEVTLLVFLIIPVTLRARYIALFAIVLDILPLLNGRDTQVAHLAHLGGAALGYVYIKSLGYGGTPRWLAVLTGFGDKVRPDRKPKPAKPPKPAELSPEEFIRQEIDPILDKISREGMQSLTRHERKILESAKDLMQKHRR